MIKKRKKKNKSNEDIMGLGFAEQIALRTIRGILNGTIGQFTPEQLQNYINQNGNLWGDTSEGMKKTIRTVKNQFYAHYRKFFSQINTELLFEWLKQDQTKLYIVITASDRNRAWFDQQVKTFLKKIEET